MKPWQINIIFYIACVAFGYYFIFGNIGGYAIAFAVCFPFVSSLLVYADASRLHTEKYKKTSFFSGGPLMYAIAVVFFWYIALPIYISFRKKIIDGKIPLKEMPEVENKFTIKIIKKILGVILILSLAVVLTIPFWGYKAFPDMKLPTPGEIYGYKPKNLLPMYGNSEKTAEEKKADEEFVSFMIKEAGSQEKASWGLSNGAITWLEKGDLDTAMKRYNQAWLLDNNNPEAYFGFAEILKKQGDQKGAEEMLQKAELLKSSAVSKYKEAILEGTIIDIGLTLDDWYLTNKESYLGFLENKANADKINGMMSEIKNRGIIEAEYSIYTISQNYVVKLRAKGDSNFYCINFQLLSESAKSPEITFKTIAVSGDNFTSKNNCDGKPLK